MLVNGYKIGDEPTREEFHAYWKVKRFLMEEWIAGWLDGKEPLEQEDFIAMCDEFEDADFSAEETDYLEFLYGEIHGTPYDDPGDERWRLEFGLCDEEEEEELTKKYYGGGTR